MVTMLEQALGTETGDAAALIRAMFRVIQHEIESKDPRKIFLSGNSAATIHLQRCARLAVPEVRECDQTGKFFPSEVSSAAFSQEPISEKPFNDLIKYLQKELRHFVSFGVQNRAVFSQIINLMTPDFDLGDGFRVTSTSYHPNIYEDADLMADVLKLEVARDGQAFDVKVYASATFRYPCIDSVHETTFDCIELETFSRSFPVEGESDIFVMSLPDLLLLKHFSTLAPVADRVRTHNARIVQVLVSLIDDQQTKAYVLNCFDTLLSHVRPEKRDNGRMAKFEAIGLNAQAVDRLKAGYDVAGELLATRSGRRNVYHNIWHTDTVLGQVMQLIIAYAKDYVFKEELCFAAVFHDCNLGLTRKTLPDTLTRISERHDLGLDQADIERWVAQIFAAPTVEGCAAEIAGLFLEHAFGWEGERTQRVKDFIDATRLGYRIEVPADPNGEAYGLALGQALLQTADIFQTMIGDFHLFLANNRQLIIELEVDADQWFQDTLNMLDQLLESVTENKYDNLQFNVHLLQFSFPGKSALVERLTWGISENREKWLRTGLARCQEWAESN